MENLHNFKLEQLTVLQTITTRKSLITNLNGHYKYQIRFIAGDKSEMHFKALSETPEQTGVLFCKGDKIPELLNLIIEIQNRDGSFVKEEEPPKPRPYKAREDNRPQYTEEGNRDLEETPQKWFIKSKATGEEKQVKPPLGLMPRAIWETQRIAAIMEAAERYQKAGKKPNPEWLEELRELAAKHYPETPAARSKLLNLIGGF